MHNETMLKKFLTFNFPWVKIIPMQIKEKMILSLRRELAVGES